MEKIVEKPVVQVVEKTVEKIVATPVVKIVEKPIIKKVYRTQKVRNPFEFAVVSVISCLLGILIGYFL